ncbi:MAG: hypothetical protein ACUVR0_02925 [Candidatus Aminicenantales bacterium]
MKKASVFSLGIFFLVTAIAPLSAQLNFRLGLEGELFKRDITSGENGSVSPLNSYFTTLRLELESGGFALSLFGGFASSNFNTLVFRGLPFSIEFEGGGLSGLIFGAELSKVFLLNSLGVGGEARFISYTGNEKKWGIPELAVEGELKSKPIWQQISVGPVLVYNRYENFIPFATIQYNRLSGEFSLRQLIENLTGEEKKKIKGKGALSFSLGANFLFSSRFGIRGEASILPHEGATDWSLNVRALFAF